MKASKRTFYENIMKLNTYKNITKFLNSVIFKYFEFIEYFDDVK